MLRREVMAVYCENNAEHRNTQCEGNAEFLELNLAVHTGTTRLI
jgi:hypothetical protein